MNGCSGVACLVCSDCLIRIFDDADRTPKCPLCRREFDDFALLSQFINTGRAVVKATIERHREFRDYQHERDKGTRHFYAQRSEPSYDDLVYDGLCYRSTETLCLCVLAAFTTVVVLTIGTCLAIKS